MAPTISLGAYYGSSSSTWHSYTSDRSQVDQSVLINTDWWGFPLSG